MSDEAANVAMLKEAYRRWSESHGGTVEHWMSLCDENIAFGSLAQAPPQLEYLASYRARDALGAYFEGIKRDWDIIEYRVDHLVAQGDRVVMLGHLTVRSKATGKIVKTPKVDSWRFKDGKAIEFFEYYDTAQVIQAMAPA